MSDYEDQNVYEDYTSDFCLSDDDFDKSETDFVNNPICDKFEKLFGVDTMLESNDDKSNENDFLSSSK